MKATHSKTTAVRDVYFIQSKYSRQGYGTNMLTLACGCRLYRKQSVKVPKRVGHRCPPPVSL